MSSPNIDDDRSKDEQIFEIIKNRYDDELERSNNLDSKAHNLTGYVSIVLSIIVGVGTFDNLERLARPEYYIPYFIGIGLLIMSFLYSLSSMKIRRWTVVPDVKYVYANFYKSNYTYRTVLRQVTARMVPAVIDMEENNNIKADRVDIGWHFLIGGLGAIVLYVVIFTVNYVMN